MRVGCSLHLRGFSCRALAVLVLLAGAPPGAAFAQGSTQSSLSAPRVDRQIKIRLEGKTITFALDGRDDFHELESGQLIVASHPVKITVPMLNPLELQFTVSRDEAADPAHESLGKLLTALLQLPGIFDPDKAADARSAGEADAFLELARASEPACTALVEAGTIVKALRNNLFPAAASAGDMKTAIDDWKKTIGGDPGPSGVVKARTAIQALEKGLEANVAAALEAIRKLEDATPPDTLQRFTRPTHEGAPAPQQKQKTPLELLKEEVAALDARLSAELARLEASGKTSCETTAQLLLLLARLSQPRTRLEELKSIVSAVEQLHKGLEPYADPDNWLPEKEGGETRTNYILLDEVRPASATMQTFTVKAVRVTFDPTESALATATEEAGAGAFTVRRFRRFTAEIGAGLVLSDVRRPKYGTDTDAGGNTIVGVAENEDESYDAAVLANFVCRCGWGEEFAPLIQIGVAPRPSSPSLLFGAGFRLFGLGKGDVALGIGAILAWVKDLNDLKPGDPVGGTSDIEADLTYQQRTHPYVALLYQF